MLRRMLNRRGSALVWAVCVMMVLVLISAGVLTVSTAYYNDTLDEIELKKAQLLAQSGANYAYEIMMNGTEWAGEKSWFPKEILNVESGKTKTSRALPVYFDGSKTDCAELTFSAVKKEQTDSNNITTTYYVIKVESTATCNGKTATCSALFYGNGQTEGGGDTWEFAGYTQY